MVLRQERARRRGFIDLSGTVETLEKPFQPHEFFWKVHRMLSDPQAVLALSEARPPAPRDLDGEIAHAVIIPDEDLLEWMRRPGQPEDRRYVFR